MSTQPISDLDLDWTFGDRVRKIRRASGDSQETFAQRIGQKKESLAAWETGRNAQPRGVVAIASSPTACRPSGRWALKRSKAPIRKDRMGAMWLPRLDSNQ